MPWYAIAAIVLEALATAGVIMNIGKEREPITPELALVCLIANGLVVWVIVALAGAR